MVGDFISVAVDRRRNTRVIEVELDAFSGRPNPRWNLDEDTSAQPVEQLQTLLVTRSSVSVQPGLGYRGFILHGADFTARVFGGVVQVNRGEMRASYRDTKGIEDGSRADAAERSFGSVVRLSGQQ